MQCHKKMGEEELDDGGVVRVNAYVGNKGQDGNEKLVVFSKALISVLIHDSTICLIM